MTTERNPSLATVVRLGIDRRLAELRTATVGVVESYSQGKASVQLLRPDPIQLEDGTWEYIRGPVVNNVPVAFPGTTVSKMRITLPVQRGDFVTLVFSDRELAQWLATGREVDPESPRTFDVSDAIAFLGPQPHTGSWTDDATCITIGSESGAEAFVAKANDVLSALQDIATKFNGHTHSVASAPGPTGPPTAAAVPTTITPPASVGSTTVKVKG